MEGKKRQEVEKRQKFFHSTTVDSPLTDTFNSSLTLFTTFFDSLWDGPCISAGPKRVLPKEACLYNTFTYFDTFVMIKTKCHSQVWSQGLLPQVNEKTVPNKNVAHGLARYLDKYLQSWTKVMGHFCVSGAFSNSHRSNPSPHPTNNVERVYPEVFPSFNFV